MLPAFRIAFITALLLACFLNGLYAGTNSGMDEVQKMLQTFREAKDCPDSTRAHCLDEALRNVLAAYWRQEHHKARMAVYQGFLDYGNALPLSTYLKASQDMKQEAEACQEDACLTKAHNLMAKGFLREGNIEEAQRESSLALIHAAHSGQEELSIECNLSHADILMRSADRNARVDALNILLRAKLKALELEMPGHLAHCYDALYNFYADIGEYDSSASFKERQIQLFIQSQSPDSGAIQRIRIELAEPLLKGENSVRGTQILDEIIAYGIRHRDAGLVNEAMMYYRNYFLEQKNLIGIASLYTQKFPGIFGFIDNAPEQHRVKAYLFDATNQKDSAIYYYRLTSDELRASENKFQYSFFQLFYGRALRRWGLSQEAVEVFKNGMAAAQGYLPFLIQFSAECDTSYHALKESDSAYAYLFQHAALLRSWDSSINGEALLRQQVAAQSQEQQLAEKKLEHLREQRHFTQYLAITLGIVILFLIFCFLSSLSVPKWVISATGFFSFVVLFEFIIMVSDEYAAKKVKGEPLFLLLCKIGIILLLSPLHHKLEVKLLHYFHEHKLVNTSRLWDWTDWKNFVKLFNKSKQARTPKGTRNAVVSVPKKPRKPRSPKAPGTV